jgi:hypothetical protein
MPVPEGLCGPYCCIVSGRREQRVSSKGIAIFASLSDDLEDGPVVPFYAKKNRECKDLGYMLYIKD